jgi:uncharacterized membrane protein YfcA
MEEVWLFYILMSLVAFLYASIGHGGATGYIAIMTLFNFLPEKLRPLALILNIVVAAVALFFFTKVSRLPKKLTLVVLLGSLPMAFIGGQYKLSNQSYHLLLALLLLIPLYRLLFEKNEAEESFRLPNFPLLFIIGIVLGLISGLIGIGGGVLLAPLLLMNRWANIKETAAISALFIILNSIAGLVGLVYAAGKFPSVDISIIPMIACSAAAGAYIGSHLLPVKTIKKLLALVLIIAIIKLILVS